MDIPLTYLSIFAGITSQGSWDIWDIFALAVLVFLLFLSGFMSSSEVAFFSLSPQDVFEIKESDSPQDAKLLGLLSHSEQLLATILIGNNVVNLMIVMLSGYMISSHVDFSTSPIVAFVIQTVLLTFVLLLFGEIIPKVYAQSRPLAFIRSIVSPFSTIYKVLSPAARTLMKSSFLIDKHGKEKKYRFSVDELSKAVELTTDASEQESEMISEIIKFYNKTADEIMVPRIDMVDLDLTWDFRRMMQTALDSGYSRLPVYEGSEDTIKGILYVKDMIPHMNQEASFAWQELIRPAYFVPENKKIDDLLEELRHERIHMAIVVDEYGGTCGLITLEDILEEIVGEIVDEYDEEEKCYTQLSENTFLFEARTTLTDLAEILHLEDDYFESYVSVVDTLSGLFLEIKQEIPQINDTVEYKDLRLEITQMERLRILQIKLTRKPTP